MRFQLDEVALAHVRETLWDNFWTEGGFGMYPVAFWGFLLLLYAGFYVLRPQERYLRAVAILAFMTLASGALGTIMGLMIAFRYAASVEPAHAAQSAALGASEAIHVVLLALFLVNIGGIITGIGSRRHALLRANA